MTRTASHGVSEKFTVTTGVNASHRYSRPAPRLPKFVDHPELKGRWAYERLFTAPAESVSRNSVADREIRRFKRMHFCGRRIRTLLERHGAGAVLRSDYKRFAPLYQELRDAIASDNLGLVYDMYKRTRIVNVDGDEMLSEGMMALTRAIDTFNPWLGFRFSTYACNAITRAFYRCGWKESRRRQCESASFENSWERSDWLDTRRTEESILYVERLAGILAGDTADLTEIEGNVLAQRFPLGPKARRRTLADIGSKMSLSKERVRQIEKVALVKLRSALERDPVLSLDPHPVRGATPGG